MDILEAIVLTDEIQNVKQNKRRKHESARIRVKCVTHRLTHTQTRMQCNAHKHTHIDTHTHTHTYTHTCSAQDI